MTAQQWHYLRKNSLFVTGAAIVLIALLITLGGAGIRPDSSPYANEQHIELALLKPFSKVRYLKIKRNEKLPEYNAFISYFTGWHSDFIEVPYDSLTFSGMKILLRKPGQLQFMTFYLPDVCYSLPASLELQDLEDGEAIQLKNGEKIQLDNAAMQQLIKSDHLESKTFVFGTDKFGRDVLSRLLSGSYISLSVGIISVMISLILGIALGTCAGYYRGWTDRLIMWLINVVWSVPTLLLVIAVTLALGKGFWQIFIAVGLTMWVEVARVVRGQVMALREREFIQAGVVLGYSDLRIITNHLIPNIMSPVIVISAANFATAILLEAGLSFLGIGAPPPQATWGKMISEHKAYIITGDAHLALIPGISIMLLVLSFTFIGNSLRDAFDENRSNRDYK